MLSPSFKERESAVAQEREELYCSDFGAAVWQHLGAQHTPRPQHGSASRLAHPDTTDSVTSFFPPQADPRFTKEQAEAGRADEIPKAGWGESPTLHLSLCKTFPITRLLSSFTFSGPNKAPVSHLFTSLCLKSPIPVISIPTNLEKQWRFTFSTQVSQESKETGTPCFATPTYPDPSSFTA